MRNSDILGMCLRNLFKRKLRTILTMLGVVIGTVAIVVTVSLGLAVDERFNQIIDGMGDVNVVTVTNPNSRFAWWDLDNDGMDVDLPDLDNAAVQLFENMPGVGSVLPVIQSQDLVFRSGDYTFWGQVNGVRPYSLHLLGYEVQEGRLLNEGASVEAVFGSGVPLQFNNIFAPWDEDRWRRIWMGEEVDPFVDALNDRFLMSYDFNFIFGSTDNQAEDIAFDAIDAPRPIRPIQINVVGVLQERNDWAIDNSIFMDIELVQRMAHEAQRSQQQGQMDWLAMDNNEWIGQINARANVQPDTGYDIVYVRAENLDFVAEIAEQIRGMGYPVSYATQQISAWQEMAQGQQTMLGAIGAVSLFVAAIGIANTMVMSTYERTREIGVMKVIGAALSDIKKLFLMEAAMIGLIGGIFGVLFSYLASYILNNYSDIAFMGGMLDGGADTEQAVVSLITPWLSGLALFFAALIGLASGYFPARRATRLSALNAIRTE